MKRTVHTIFLATFFLLSTAACDGGPNRADQKLHVYAASSLADVFADLEEQFEATHPDIDVLVTIAGSQTLRLQIEHGARADVFASANRAHLDALVEAGYVGEMSRFAGNELVLVTPRDNPAGLQSFYELPRAQRLVIGTADVPAGIYARQAITRASESIDPDFERSVMERVVSEETNVRHVRAKVELGEADAGIIYRTDAIASGHRLRALSLPEELAVSADYFVGTVEDSANPRVADEWRDMLASAEGRAVLDRHGFLAD